MDWIMGVMLDCHVDNVNTWNRVFNERSKEPDTISVILSRFVVIPITSSNYLGVS